MNDPRLWKQYLPRYALGNNFMEINTWDNAEYLDTFALLNQQRPAGINGQSGSVFTHILKAFNILEVFTYMHYSSGFLSPISSPANACSQVRGIRMAQLQWWLPRGRQVLHQRRISGTRNTKDPLRGMNSNTCLSLSTKHEYGCPLRLWNPKQYFNIWSPKLAHINDLRPPKMLLNKNYF